MDTTLETARSMAARCAARLPASLDWIAVSPHGKTVKLDNEHVRVVDVTFAPGVPEPVHVHPAHVAFVIEGGSFRVDYASGASETLEAAPGDVFFFEPDAPHTGVNLGDAPIRALIVELKHLPYVAAAA